MRTFLTSGSLRHLLSTPTLPLRLLLTGFIDLSLFLFLFLTLVLNSLRLLPRPSPLASTLLLDTILRDWLRLCLFGRRALYKPTVTSKSQYQGMETLLYSPDFTWLHSTEALEQFPHGARPSHPFFFSFKRKQVSTLAIAEAKR